MRALCCMQDALVKALYAFMLTSQFEILACVDHETSVNDCLLESQKLTVQSFKASFH